VDILGGKAALWATDSGQDGFKDFFSQDKQCSERSDAGPSDSVTSAVSDALDQFFAAELAQVVGSLARMVFGHGWALLVIRDGPSSPTVGSGNNRDSGAPVGSERKRSGCQPRGSARPRSRGLCVGDQPG
jgi:hypothetical protein